MNGYLNIFKPTGLTSSNVVSRVRYNLKLKRVGHAGTLDPAAAGVLPVMIGSACKMFDYLNLDRKKYISEFTFGHHTNTLDQQGEILQSSDTVPSTDDIKRIIAEKFIGAIDQIPPKISAISIDGKRAYAMARDGKEFSIPSRKITIYNYKLLRQTGEKSFLFEIECSKGTYIRSLCRDLAKQLNSLAYVSFLLRSESGYFNMNNAITLEELEQHSTNGTIADYIINIDAPLSHLEALNMSKKYEKKLLNGGTVELKGTEDKKLIKVYIDNGFIGIGRAQNEIVKIQKLFI